ncbi:hypothetical protein AKO1_002384 [Acrasis kona]|uniref:N-acetyltransferase domain-containing protein n=1 Tax=Acrasis kona TaxID=1008807 RepID=A0AAW2ZRC9_9EUKA
MNPKKHDIVEVSSSDKSTLKEIGQFRIEIWRKEGGVAEELFGDGVWLDDMDAIARHWIIRDDDQSIVAVSRLTVHETLHDNPDGYLWEKENKVLPEPVANISKLAVHEKMRGRGIASELNSLRIQKAKEMGCKSMIVTASTANARLLISKHGFKDTGIRVIFPNRPTVEFLGLELIF